MIVFSPQEALTRILVVENITHMAKIILEMLRLMGFRDVHRAGNVVHAFQFVTTHHPGLIIGEGIIQPHGAIKLCKTLRVACDSPDRQIPVVVTIAEPTPAAVASARDAGCHAILAKPVSAANLATKIASILRHPPRFIATKAYTGPDRRRAVLPLKTAERRSKTFVPANHNLAAHEVLGIDPEILSGTKPPPAHLVADDNTRALLTEVPAAVIRKIPISQLVAGMELAEPLISGTALVVVPRGVVLTRDLVPRLIDLAEKGKIPSVASVRT